VLRSQQALFAAAAAILLAIASAGSVAAMRERPAALQPAGLVRQPAWVPVSAAVPSPAQPAGAKRAARARPPAPGWRPPARPAGARYLLARLLRPLRTAAGSVAPRTDFGSPTWLLVVSRHGPHARGLVPFAGGRTAPLDLRHVPLRWTGMRVAVDVAALRLAIYDGGRLLARFTVGAGSPTTPTPRGRFTVTDHVRFPADSPYGALALGISVRQHDLPASWSGGDQVAIHGTNAPWSIGQRVSLGCIRVPDWALRLLRRVPLGAPVVVSS
jgi:hypothetical protein